MTTSTVNGMASRGWAFLACRVLALYLFYLAIETLLSIGMFPFIYPSEDGTAWPLGYFYIFRFLLAFSVGLGLWFGAARLARKMVQRQAEEREEIAPGAWTVAQLLSLAVSVLGLVLLFFAVPRAAGLVAIYLVEDRLHDRDLIEIATVATRLVLGIVLVFGSRGIANVIAWARGWQAG